MLLGKLRDLNTKLVHLGMLRVTEILILSEGCLELLILRFVLVILSVRVRVWLGGGSRVIHPSGGY